MTSIHPDQITAERLAGLSRGPVTALPTPGTGDGLLIDDPAVRGPLASTTVRSRK